MKYGIERIDGLICEDHRTFVVSPQREREFLAYWEEKGFSSMPTIITRDYPAKHIALVENLEQIASCEKMVGLSVSNDPCSPINKTIALYGDCHIKKGLLVPGRLQHTAYAVDNEHSIENIRAVMEEKGVKFMTPILYYKDESSGAFLKQMFVACSRPYGIFMEIIQRGKGRNGEPFRGFYSMQIDNLYRFYDEFSKKLLHKLSLSLTK